MKCKYKLSNSFKYDIKMMFIGLFVLLAVLLSAIVSLYVLGAIGLFIYPGFVEYLNNDIGDFAKSIATGLYIIVVFMIIVIPMGICQDNKTHYESHEHKEPFSIKIFFKQWRNNVV
jgi:hypothetical protein